MMAALVFNELNINLEKNMKTAFIVKTIWLKSSAKGDKRFHFPRFYFYFISANQSDDSLVWCYNLVITVKPVLTTTFLKRPPLLNDHIVVLP